MSDSTQEFLALIERRLTEITTEWTDPLEAVILFQRLSFAIQCLKATCQADTFAMSESTP